MSDIVIKVENISKQYRLGNVGTGTLVHDLNQWWHRVRGKGNPYDKIGETNDRTIVGKSDYVWALKNINFEIKQGEVIGIIGRNGAGKSTLLKILSKTTTPTTGSIKIKGKIASLLEVGTGFHPELSGRDNIFLNGAILGMTKSEIKSKFNEIVEFAGVERYIDTPVKRYSSGMYVRLAFAVAAHLDPEILIVDEVLAVGDAEFQKKALGKMKDISKAGGRTVIFVSHNMVAIKNLCSSIIYMNNGNINQIGTTDEVINNYLSQSNWETNMRQFYENIEEAPGNQKVKMRRIEICPLLNKGESTITINTSINIEFDFWNINATGLINLSMALFSILDECVFATISNITPGVLGENNAVCTIPQNLLNDGQYYISMLVVEDGEPVYNFENIVKFEVSENRQATAWHGKWPGIVRPKLDFKLN